MDAGVNDFSISLDACCSKDMDMMSSVDSNFDHLSKVIKFLSFCSYVTVGIVLNKKNKDNLLKIIDYASGLGVSDIRIIPSAQYNKKLDIDLKTKYKILNYRLANIRIGRHVRGLQNNDCSKCHLVKDDMVVLHGMHFPCVIYMREGGDPIGSVYGKSLHEIRNERKTWFNNKLTHSDPICKKSCLDVCIDYNNRVEEFVKGDK
jgi:hypothetical protein